MSTLPTPSSTAPCAAVRGAAAPPTQLASKLGSLSVTPFVPEAVLRRHHAYVAGDTRFTAACRLLTSLWREEHNLPLGTHAPEPRRAKGQPKASSAPPTRPIRLGSRLSPVAARAGATFLTPAIAAYTREVLLFREPGALFEETRLWGNLLSSQAMVLNLLAPLALDLDLATAVWRRLMPAFVHTVTGFRFEHSPGRRGPAYYGDGTAFDVIIDIVTPDGEPAFVALEVKYTEGAGGIVPPPRPCYADTTRGSGLYLDPEAALLMRPGYEQLRREHVMAQLMVQHGVTGRGHFILLGPALNQHVQTMGRRYADHLAPADGADRPSTVGFSVLTLEAVVGAIAEAGAVDLTASFATRYLDFSRVVRCVLDTPLPPHPGAPAVSVRRRVLAFAPHAPASEPRRVSRKGGRCDKDTLVEQPHRPTPSLGAISV